ncbi:MAG: endolytic transglycosylase MltG [Ruminococcus sp.]|nr:endolytic transglycosylase MltG [Ruminococcus sp.]
MNNNRNPNRDEMLEDILNDFSSNTRNSSASGHSDKRNNSRSSYSRSAPRKTVNPAALSSNHTTGFAVSKKPEAENAFNEDNSVNNSATAKMNILEKDNSYNEYSLSMTKQESFGIKVSPDESTENNYIHTANVKPKYSSDEINAHYPQRSRPVKKRRKKRSARLPIVLMVTTLIFTVSICLSILIIAVGRDMLAIGKGETVKMVTIPEGADTKTVASILEKEEIIDIPKAFEIFSSLNGSDELFIPGQYELSSGDAYETIITILTTEETEDDRESVDVTFVEGTSIYDAAQILEENNVCDAERFIYFFNAGGFGFDFETKLPASSANKFYKMEGYLFPDTYTFYVESEPQSVCMKIYQNFETKITDEHYKQMDKMGMTLDEVITLASIVQAEAPTADSMKMVASVFVNRLNNEDMFPMLQSDPTTYYVQEVIEPNIQVSSTAIFDAYDTYKCHGLPAGAIGNPGMDAIEAVLYHEDTDYFYFCADIDTMEIYYSETLEEHEEYLAMINGEVIDEDSDDEYYEEDYYYE